MKRPLFFVVLGLCLLAGAALAEEVILLQGVNNQGQISADERAWRIIWANSWGIEGANADNYETIIQATEPTADNTLTIPNDSGAFIISELTTNTPDAANSIWGESNKLVFEGATANAYELSITVADPTAARTLTLPDASGTPMLSTLSTNAPDAANSVTGGTNALIFEGSSVDGFETSLTASNPTADNTVTIPDGTGTILMGGRLALTASSGYTAGVGMSISAASMLRYTTFTVDTTGIGQGSTIGIGPEDGTGVTIALAAPTEAISGKPITFINLSGTTDIFLYASGLPIDTGSGVTDNLVIDGAGDLITIIPDYNSAVSYYVQSYRIH